MSPPCRISGSPPLTYIARACDVVVTVTELRTVYCVLHTAYCELPEAKPPLANRPVLNLYKTARLLPPLPPFFSSFSPHPNIHTLTSPTSFQSFQLSLFLLCIFLCIFQSLTTLSFNFPTPPTSIFQNGFRFVHRSHCRHRRLCCHHPLA